MSRARKVASAAGGAVRYASRTTGVNFEKYLTWAAIGGIGYLVLKTIGLFKSASDVLTSAGSAAGGAVYEWLHPNAVGETIFYTARFPDGSFHTVPSLSVASDGTFTNKGSPPLYVGDGKVYRLAVSKTPFYFAGGSTPYMAVAL